MFLVCEKERPGTEGKDQFENIEFPRSDSWKDLLSTEAIGQLEMSLYCLEEVIPSKVESLFSYQGHERQRAE